MKRPPKKSSAESVNEVCSIRLELQDSDPLIWRELEVPTSITLKVLHDIIQIVMDWFDYHLWEFTVGGGRYGPPVTEDWGTTPRKEAIKVRLREVLKPRKTIVDYHYDFGDDWEVRLTISNVRQGDATQFYPRLLRGERAAPPEDCGGIPGFYELLDTLADPDHPDHDEVSDHFDGYNPDEVDMMRMNFALGLIANRRMAAHTSAAKWKAKLSAGTKSSQN